MEEENYQQTIREALTKTVYARVIELNYEERPPKYMVAVLFKYTHKYRNDAIFDSEEKAIELFNEVIK